MSRIPQRESGLEWARREFDLCNLRAQFWMASAVSGHATRAKRYRGREPTPEEREQGIVLGREPLSDAEKIDDAMALADQFITKAMWLRDLIMAYVNDNYDSYKSAYEAYQRAC